MLMTQNHHSLEIEPNLSKKIKNCFVKATVKSNHQYVTIHIYSYLEANNFLL